MRSNNSSIKWTALKNSISTKIHWTYFLQLFCLVIYGHFFYYLQPSHTEMFTLLEWVRKSYAFNIILWKYINLKQEMKKPMCIYNYTYLVTCLLDIYSKLCMLIQSFSVAQLVKESTCNAGDPGSISGSGRSPGVGYGNPLQFLAWRIRMDRGAWQVSVHGVAKSWTWLSN